MKDPLILFAAQRAAISLSELRDGLREAGYPVTISTQIAGEATESELANADWEAVFVRWTEPELHEVWYVERSVTGEDDEADAAIAEAMDLASRSGDAAGKLVVQDQLRRTVEVLFWQILPAQLADEDHRGWEALDAALRMAAGEGSALIYASETGFYDTDGELMLAIGED